MAFKYVNERAQQMEECYLELRETFPFTISSLDLLSQRTILFTRYIRGELLQREYPVDVRHREELSELTRRGRVISFSGMESTLREVLLEVHAWHERNQTRLYRNEVLAAYHFYKHRRSFEREAEVSQYFELVDVLVDETIVASDGAVLSVRPRDANLLLVLGVHRRWLHGLVGQGRVTHLYKYLIGHNPHEVRIAYYHATETPLRRRRQPAGRGVVVTTCFRRNCDDPFMQVLLDP
jgi:hypothetical protein